MEKGNSYLYQRIDELLAENNMSRRQLAKAIGVPPTTLQSAFEKKSNIPIERLRKILAVLNARYEDIYPPEQLEHAIKYNIIKGINGEEEAPAYQPFIESTSSIKEQVRGNFSELNAEGKAQAVNAFISCLWERWHYKTIPVFEDLLYILDKDETLAKMVVDKLEALVVAQKHPELNSESLPDKDPTQK